MRRGMGALTGALLGGLAAAVLLVSPGPAEAKMSGMQPAPKPTAAKQPSSEAARVLSKVPPVKPNLPVALLADDVQYDDKTGRVVATGHVQIFYGQRTLTADRVIYDSRAGKITAEGKLVMRDPSGVTVFGSFAELDSDLRNGLVRGAKAVIAENIKLSAVEARRVEGRYNVLSKAVYSPCNVCAHNPTPLWRIRARKVIHDQKEHRIHYEDATFDLFGVPVMWLPWLSQPDPTVKRASGFLVPSFQQSSTYGFGVQVPYYWVIDNYSDLTFTPFLTTGAPPIGIVEYRRNFQGGTLQLEGSLTYDNYTGQYEPHGHLVAHGDFKLPAKFHWGFDGTLVTDDGYLARYNFSNEDRLTSELWLRRYGSSGFFDLTGVYFRSLRNDEPANQIPLVVPDFNARYNVPKHVLGGELGFFASSAVLLRDQGLDANRMSIGADWERRAVLPWGLALRGFAKVRGDLYMTSHFGTFDSATATRFSPLAGVEARYPLIDTTGGGVSHVIEPIAQAIIAPYGLNPSDIPNEDSRVVEFDTTNLFDTSRFPGYDLVEEGPRLNLGLRYDLIAPNGVGFDATIGRVLRPRSLHAFSAGSGLRDPASDWVAGWALHYPPYVTLQHRFRVGDDGSLARNEVDAQFAYGPATLSLGYVFLRNDPSVQAPHNREEVNAHGDLTLTRNWKLSGLVRRDLERNRFVEAGGGLAYENECCRVELFVKRRFTNRQDAPPSTTVGLQLRLFTLGNNDYTSR